MAILFNNNFEYKIDKMVRNVDGCFIIMDMEILNKHLTLVNMYGPSSGDNPAFFDNICKKIMETGNQYTITVGDWNVFSILTLMPITTELL